MRIPGWMRWGALCGALAGCGQSTNVTNGDGGKPGNSGDGGARDLSASYGDGAIPDLYMGPPISISGLRVHHFVTAAGEVLQPVDYSKVAIAAHVMGANGTVSDYPGTGKSDGTFAIAGVPSGQPYFVEFEAGGIPNYLFSTATSLDLSDWFAGRPDVAPNLPTDGGTHLDFVVGGLDAWKNLDTLQLTSLNAGFLLFSPQSQPGTTNLPMCIQPFCSAFGGDTSLNHMVTLYPDYAPLVNADAGDTTVLAQLSQQAGGLPTTDGGVISSVIQGLSESTTLPLTVERGQLNEVMGTLAPPAVMSSTPLTWHHGAFSQYAGDFVAPDAGLFGAELQVLAIDALPGDGGVGVFTSTPDVFIYTLIGPTGGISEDESVMASYGDPYSGTGFSLIGVAQYQRPFAIGALPVTEGEPGDAGSPPFVFPASISCYYDLATFQAGVSPTVSPVRDPRVGGQTLWKAQFGVGTSPTLSWTAPSLGTPVDYRVFIGEVVADAQGNPQGIARARLFTTATQVTVPPGILTAGSYYFLLIDAFAAAGNDLARRPLQSALPSCLASTVTAFITP